MFRNRTGSQASLPPMMKDQVIRGRPMTIDDDSQFSNGKNASQSNTKEKEGKRRTFMGMHIGGGKDKAKEQEKDKDNFNRRQSFSSQNQAVPLPRESGSNGRSSMQATRTYSNSGPSLNLNGLTREANGQQQFEAQNGRLIMGQSRSPGLQASPKISQDGSSIRSGSYTDSNQNHSAQTHQQQPEPQRDSRASPAPAAKEPGMASPRISQAQTQLPTRRPSTINPALSRVFQPLMELIQLQSKKMYGCSPPEIEMIFARTPQGGPPKQGTPGSPRNDWDEIWMQLSGTSLSVWSMKETKEADQRGERVPPTYYNVTDSSLELLAPLPPPPHRSESHPHPFVFSLNTAGSNRILLSCRSENNLALWVSALRLAAYEKSRIEEIYTGHLLQTFVRSSNRGGPTLPPSSTEKPSWNEPDSPLVKGRMEGWVRVRVMGGTEWKRLWLVLSAPASAITGKETGDKRRRSLFGFGGGSTNDHQSSTSLAGIASTNEFGGPATEGGTAVFYPGPPAKGTARSNKGASSEPPVLTVTHVSQAYAVFPEHLEVITSSNLLKINGHISGSMVVVEGRPRLSGWAMVMPEKLNGDGPASPNGKDDAGIVAELLKWVVGFHDAFSLYGRGKHYNWDREDPESLFFGYYGQPKMSRFFINPTQALEVDYHKDVVSEVRRAYARIAVTVIKQGATGNTVTPSQSLALTNPHPSPPARMNSSDSPASFQSSQNDDGARTPDGRYEYEREYYDDEMGQPQIVSMPSSGSIPHRDDGTLTPITERSDYVASTRSPSMATVATLDRTGRKGGSLSSKEKPNSGSGSNRDQYLSRKESFGNRLETALVAEQTDSTSDSHEKPNQEVVQTDPHPRFGLVDGAMPPPPPAKNERRPSLSAGTAGIERAINGGDSAPSSASVYSPGVSTFVTHANSRSDDHGETAQPPLAKPLPLMEPGLVIHADNPLLSSSPMNASNTGVIAPKPRKAGDQFDEDQVLLDNHYLLDQIQLAEPNERSTSPRALSVQSRASDALSISPSTSRNGLGRKPSGARAMPKPRQSSMSSAASLSPNLETAERTKPPPPAVDLQDQGPTTPKQRGNRGSTLPHSVSMSADALAALSFVDAMPSPGKPDPQATPPAVPRPPLAATQPAFRSSFAPTQGAIERKERAQEAEKRKEHVMTRPGKAGGGKKLKKAAWSASSEEDSEGDEQENSDESDTELKPPSRPDSNYGSRPGSRTGRTGSPLSGVQRLGTPPSRSTTHEQSTLGRGAPVARPSLPVEQGHARVPRNLPPIPGMRNSTFEHPRSSSMTVGGGPGSQFSSATQQAPHDRSSSWTGAPQTNEPTGYVPTNQDLNQLGTSRPNQQARSSARQNMWTSALDAPHAPAEESNPNGKFITLEPSAQMTKAFTPHGLLQAGLQDKEDRSAKKQQEIAKETGASLLNVPNKPPEPQTGLLGAITAHERDRKAAGGLGAALTERERDRRLAEERQRQIDEMQSLQRQTMYPGSDAFARPMSAYGGAGGGMMSPGMGAYGNPSMYWPAPPMNPYAQQQAMMAAQMAYQSSMYMAMSAAGSQVGTPDVGVNATGGNGFDGRAMSPMMSPPGMGGAAGGNPYMSMYGGYAPSLPGGGVGGGMLSPGGGMFGPGAMMGMPPMGSPGMGGMMSGQYSTYQGGHQQQQGQQGGSGGQGGVGESGGRS